MMAPSCHFDFDRGPRQRDWPLDALDAKCAFYDKCARRNHEYVGENQRGREPRQALLFDK